MSSITITHLYSLPGWHSTCVKYPSLNRARVEHVRLKNKWVPGAMYRNEIGEDYGAVGGNSEDNVAVDKETSRVEDEGVADFNAYYDRHSKIFSKLDLENLGLSKDDIEYYKNLDYLPPLVCCFGAAPDRFVPSGRRARILCEGIDDVDLKGMWFTDGSREYIRAPGSCAGAVAIALKELDEAGIIYKMDIKVAFMGKLGDDYHGLAILHNLNEKKISTRSVCFDMKRETALSRMKFSKSGRLKMTCTQPCAEDSLLKSEIKVDVLLEATAFYFTTQSLLDKNMRSVTLEAIKIARKLKTLIFYDVNLPFPLWQSSQETKQFIEEAWSLADVIEVTEQELEFLYGIKPDTELLSNIPRMRSIKHFKPRVIQPLLQGNLKVLFVSNGTSALHCYTKEYHGAVEGMEFYANLNPLNRDLSVVGDHIVTGLVKALARKPDCLAEMRVLGDAIKSAMVNATIDTWAPSSINGMKGCSWIKYPFPYEWHNVDAKTESVER